MTEIDFVPNVHVILSVQRSAEGLLTMATSGVHTNGSQFFVTTEPAPHLDGRCVAFGRVTAGIEVIRAINSLYAIRGKPVSEIKIDECGELDAETAG